MILKFFLWVLPLFFVAFDMSFFDVFVIFPLFFYTESLNEFSFEKALRYITYLSLYVLVNYHEFNLLFALLIFIIIIIDSSQKYWMKVWVLPLMQSLLFFTPLLFERYFFSYIFSISLFFIIFVVLFEKKIIAYS
ncbi:MAG: hypothetical protein H0Z22_05050 [Thermosipho sp. (in: Bacteria)]|nr:hypothetical protein [Thermosipho sp. (in: thermotogales)]